MTRRLALVLAVALLAFVPSLASAHGGGLDRCGGHNDRQRGGYHVHNWANYCRCHPESNSCAKAPTAPLVSPQSTTPTPAVPADVAGTVYVTASGTKYHRAGCRYLTATPIALAEVGSRYGPCSVCRPPPAPSAGQWPGCGSPSHPLAT